LKTILLSDLELTIHS